MSVIAWWDSLLTITKQQYGMVFGLSKNIPTYPCEVPLHQWMSMHKQIEIVQIKANGINLSKKNPTYPCEVPLHQWMSMHKQIEIVKIKTNDIKFISSLTPLFSTLFTILVFANCWLMCLWLWKNWHSYASKACIRLPFWKSTAQRMPSTPS